MKYLIILLSFISNLSFSQNYYPCCCNNITVQPPVEEQDTAFVIVEIGQSNAAARLADELGFTLPIFNNVQIYNSVVTGNNLQTMTYGVNSGESVTTNGDQGNYSIGTIYAGNKDNKIVFKYAIGGTGLDQNTPLPNWSPSTNNSLYDEFVSNWNDLNVELAAYDVVYVEKVIWVQGERDATDLTWANNYESNLNGFMSSINAVFQNLPDWHIARLKTDINPSSYLHVLTVRAAQENIINTNSNVYLIDVDDCSIPDQVHYDDVCIITKGINL